MAVVALREFERLQCGESFAPHERTITRRQRDQLESFSEECRRRDGIQPFAYGAGGSLVAQNMVGVINLREHQVEILPKIEGATESTVRHNLVRMIALAHGLDLHDGGASQMKAEATSLLEILVRLFCARLWRAVHAGMVRRYEAREESLPVLRGRLDVVTQLRCNLGRPEVMACRFDEFTEDNALNQVLKCAVAILQRLSFPAHVQRHLSELLMVFDSVSTLPRSQLRWSAAATDRLSERYGPLLRLSRLFIEAVPPDVVTGKGEGFALLFDMNTLFERYVGEVVRRLTSGTGVRVILQDRGRYLATTEHGNGAFSLQPDVVGEEKGEVKWIADTKWKRLEPGRHREGLSPSDMYQMHAYARRYRAPDVVLMFPHHAGLGEWKRHRATYLIEGAEGVYRVAVATVDLADLTVAREQIQSVLFNEAIPALNHPI